MSLSEEEVVAVLRTVSYPGFRRDIVSLGVVRNLTLDGGKVRFELDLGNGPPGVAGPIESSARAALSGLEGIGEITVSVRGGPSGGSPALRMAGSRPSVAASGSLDSRLIPGVRHAVAVASGKGGVGKSTVAVNLAVGLARQGVRVGLLDADIYGPSIPLMMGVHEQPRLTADRQLVPFERFDVRLMSLGLLVDPDSAVIWRGPMVMKAIEQLLRDVIWGELDVLVVDMPPGTGDAQLTLSQKIRLAGAVIVTTPQDVALADAIKGVAMFRKVGVPILGIVENMSYFQCPRCSERTEIFGYGGGRREARRLGVPFLGEVPLNPAIRAGGDAGEPVVASDSASPQGSIFSSIAAEVYRHLEANGPAAEPRGIFDRFRKARGGPRD